MNHNSLQLEFMMAGHRLRGLKVHTMFHGVSKMEFYTLEQLHRQRSLHPDAEGMHVSGLAGRIHASPSAVSRMLRGLEEKELVKRSVDPKDRRNTYISLTEKGEMVCERSKTRMQAFAQAVIEDMGEENVQQFITLLNRLVDSAEKEIKNLNKGD